MQAGKLRNLITIQRPVFAAPNAYGERIKGWSVFTLAWASIEAVSGREAEYAKTFSATVNTKIAMRWIDSVDPTFRAVLGSRMFAFNAALDLDGRRRELTIYCTEIVQPITPTAAGYDGLGEAAYDTLAE